MPGPSGGSDVNDDSGQLTYVRIEYAGFEVSFGNELNGLTLAYRQEGGEGTVAPARGRKLRPKLLGERHKELAHSLRRGVGHMPRLSQSLITGVRDAD